MCVHVCINIRTQCYSQLAEWEKLAEAAGIDVALDAGETLDKIWDDPYHIVSVMWLISTCVLECAH